MKLLFVIVFYLWGLKYIIGATPVDAKLPSPAEMLFWRPIRTAISSYHYPDPLQSHNAQHLKEKTDESKESHDRNYNHFTLDRRYEYWTSRSHMATSHSHQGVWWTYIINQHHSSRKMFNKCMHVCAVLRKGTLNFLTKQRQCFFYIFYIRFQIKHDWYGHFHSNETTPRLYCPKSCPLLIFRSKDIASKNSIS